MSLSKNLPKIGVSLAVFCVLALSAIGATASADDGGSGATTPPPTPTASTDGNPWHG